LKCNQPFQCRMTFGKFSEFWFWLWEGWPRARKDWRPWKKNLDLGENKLRPKRTQVWLWGEKTERQKDRDAQRQNGRKEGNTERHKDIVEWHKDGKTEKHKDRTTERQRGTKKEQQKEGKTERQKEIERDRETETQRHRKRQRDKKMIKSGRNKTKPRICLGAFLSGQIQKDFLILFPTKTIKNQ